MVFRAAGDLDLLVLAIVICMLGFTFHSYVSAIFIAVITSPHTSLPFTVQPPQVRLDVREGLWCLVGSVSNVERRVDLTSAAKVRFTCWLEQLNA